MISIEGSEELMNDPNIEYRLRHRKDIEAVNSIVKLASGERATVKSESDWRVVGELVKFYVTRYPQEAESFLQTMKHIRSQRSSGGKVKAVNSFNEISYLGAFPEDGRLMKMIKIIFPYQSFNKEFMYKFVEKFPGFRVTGA